MERLGDAKVGFRSLTEAIDTTTPAGRMMMQMVGAFAEFERAMLRERTKAGLGAARQEGRIGGRRLRFGRWYRKAIKRPLRQHAYSRSTRGQSVGSSLCPTSYRGRPTMPNNVAKGAPWKSVHVPGVWFFAEPREGILWVRCRGWRRYPQIRIGYRRSVFPLAGS